MQIHNIQSTPALNQKWKDTLSRQRLLNLLNIDPKYVIHQEVVVKPKNNVHKSGMAVPAFASGLGMTLEPIKAKSTNNEKDQHQNPMEVEKPPAASEVVGVNTSQDSIEDVAAVAPFEDKKDSSSAMVATASAASEVKVASTVVTALPSLLPNEDDYRGTTTTTTATTSPKKISASAQNIIDSFPLLDFMQSTVLTKL